MLTTLPSPHLSDCDTGNLVLSLGYVMADSLVGVFRPVKRSFGQQAASPTHLVVVCMLQGTPCPPGLLTATACLTSTT